MAKVVLITGAGRGIGAAIAEEFASKGYHLILNYCTSETETRILQERLVKEYKIKAIVIKADISSEDEVKHMLTIATQTFNTIDVLVNNAGIAIDTLYEDKTADNFRKTLDVNLIGTFLVSKYVGDIMYANQEGIIINIASTNGIDEYFPMSLDYDASKAGVISLTHNLALQYAPYVRVNAIAPGWIATENEIKELDQDYIESEQDKIYLHRFGEPREIAKVVSFLASEDASFVNNAIIRVDGGQR